MKNFNELFVEKARTLETTPEEIMAIKKLYGTNLYQSMGFEFINSHKGFKGGKRHLLLGTTGKGKSTLSRSLIFKLAKGGKKSLWYSTEENRDDFLSYLSNTRFEIGKNIVFMHERDIVDAGADPVKEIVRAAIEENCEMIFFDNITTSSFYSSRPLKDQEKFAMQLSRAIEDINRPLFLVAHTDAKTKNNPIELMTPNDIRGYKQLSNICEVIYCWYLLDIPISKMQNGFEIVKEKSEGYIHLVKSRFGRDGQYFKMKYDKNEGIYISDEEIDSKRFNDDRDLARGKKKPPQGGGGYVL